MRSLTQLPYQSLSGMSCPGCPARRQVPEHKGHLKGHPGSRQQEPPAGLDLHLLGQGLVRASAGSGSGQGLRDVREHKQQGCHCLPGWGQSWPCAFSPTFLQLMYHHVQSLFACKSPQTWISLTKCPLNTPTLREA